MKIYVSFLVEYEYENWVELNIQILSTNSCICKTNPQNISSYFLRQFKEKEYKVCIQMLNVKFNPWKKPNWIHIVSLKGEQKGNYLIKSYKTKHIKSQFISTLNIKIFGVSW